MTQPAEQAPASPLTAYLLTMLSTLMAPGLPDLRLARLAAAEAIAAYQVRDMREQMTVVQILAFAATAFDSLRLSMSDDLPPPMKLKLHASARGLNRSARETATRLARAHQPPAAPEPSLAEQAATIGSRPAETVVTDEIPVPGTASGDPMGLASAMQTVASRLQASKGTVSSAQQAFNTQWAKTLTAVASEIGRGRHRPGNPRMSKTELLRTTLMSNGAPGLSHTMK